MRRGMRVAFGLVLLLCILIGGGYAFMSQASFGKLPEGERLDAISQSPHYEGGAFRNTEPLPPIRGNGGIVGALMKYVFSSTEGQKPTRPCLQRKPTCGGSTGIRIPSSGSAILPTSCSSAADAF